MNRFIVNGVLERYVLVDGRLGKTLINGHVMPVKRLHRGVCMTMMQGKNIPSAEIAWALTYTCWPKYPILLADGDPHNFSARNMLPIRGVPRRCVVKKQAGGYKVAGLLSVFSTPEQAKHAWRQQYSEVLRSTLAMTLQEQELEIKAYEYSVGPRVFAERANGPRKPKWKKADPKARPSAIIGRKWHYYEGEWLSVPMPVHISDDYLMRCHATKYLKAVRFRYSDYMDQTVAIVDMEPAQVTEHRKECKYCRHLPIEFT